MESNNLRTGALVSVLATVLLGPVLLFQLYYLSPRFLFFTVLVGWIAYTVAAVGVVSKNWYAYYAVVVLSLLVLALSLPQPEHYSFIYSGNYLAAATFLIGDALQVFVIVFVILFLRSGRRDG